MLGFFDHLIIAPVVLPAFFAPLMVLWMRFDTVSQRVFSVAAMVFMLGIAITLAVDAASGVPEVYRLGNWEAPFGIVLVLDKLSALMLVLTAVLGLAVTLYAIGSGWDRRGWHFHSLLQFQMMGINGAFLTGDAFNLFVFFEVLLIASYGLMIHAGGRDRLKAGVQYVVYNLAGSTLFLFALGTIYATMGTLNMADLADKVAQMPANETGLLRVGAVLLMLVFAVKAALVPFQFWLPATYTNAPGVVAALFAIMTKVGVYGIIRVYTLIFTPDSPVGTLAAEVLIPVAGITLIVGMVGILGARDMGRAVAYSVIGSVGTMMLALAQFTPAGTAAGLYYLVHSTLVAAALFLIVDMVRERRKGGLALVAEAPFRQNGLLAALFFAGAIGMAGMPPLSGFLGKLMIMDATRGQWWIWAAILITSLIAILGFARAGSTVFWKSYGTQVEEGDAPLPRPPEAPSDALAYVAAVGLLLALAAWTVFAAPATRYMQGVAQQLYTPDVYISAVMDGAYARAEAAAEAAAHHDEPDHPADDAHVAPAGDDASGH
ncbi:monovalent cation/H+ antiporter subunit D [Thioclava sp. SK-1]|uniref:monovalent cation/H+ antiporter subunit D n=1 Tax=Thioclava sp. SK-1 TaxID=1889770 RepID=UPI000826A40D|nr:monovalent cation/H+ antiporter subunit D [Thioclava sp. SK-1]OCX66957.1 monovalent cation/H+ antiporter subunit D [Thioclava sp. SK-1]